MVEYRIREGDLVVGLYLNGDKNLLLANGMPSYITKHHPLIKFCQKNKINLFIPRYYGSFESGSKFSLINCARSIEKTFELIRRGKAKELFANKEITWDNKDIFVLGHSFGALPVILSELGEESKRILSCPFVNLKKNNIGGGNAENDIYFIERAYPNVYRFNAKELIKEYNNLNYPKNGEFIIVRGSNDKGIPQEEIDFLIDKYKTRVIKFDGGHTINFDLLKNIIFS